VFGRGVLSFGRGGRGGVLSFGRGGGGIGCKKPKKPSVNGHFSTPPLKKMSFSYVERRRHTIPSPDYYYYLIKFYTFVTH
jgi:hypothetical protein